MMASRPDCPLSYPSQAELDLFRRAGVQPLALATPLPLLVARGYVAEDGLFDISADGQHWFAIQQPDANDTVFWHLQSGQIASWAGRTFALGERVIDLPETYGFYCALNIFDNPIDWLRARRDGIVVLPNRWELAFDRLRDCPRIAVAERLLSKYQRHMHPPRTPELLVLADRRRAA